MKDIHSLLFAAAAFGPVVQNGTPSPAGIGLAGYMGVEILVSVGVGGITFDSSNKIDILIEESDDDTTYTPVAAKDILGADDVGAGVLKSFDADHPAAANYRWGYTGSKAFLRVTPVFSGTHGAGTPISISLLLGEGENNPQDSQS